MKKFFYALMLIALAVSTPAEALAPQKALFTSGGAVVTPPLTDPSTISGLTIWLDSSDSGSITHSGGQVSQWSDKSGNLNHATQGTVGQRPITGTRTINGLNVIDFDGSNDGMVFPSGTYSIAGGNYTIFVVNFSDVTSTESRQTITGESASFVVDFGVQYGPIASPNLLAFGGGSQATRTVTRDTNAHTFVVRRGTTNTLLYFDGGTAGSGTSNNETLINMTLGYSPSYGDRWDGVFAEILVYNSQLSTTDTNRVGNYLATKWGSPWSNI